MAEDRLREIVSEKHAATIKEYKEKGKDLQDRWPSYGYNKPQKSYYKPPTIPATVFNPTTFNELALNGMSPELARYLADYSQVSNFESHDIIPGGMDLTPEQMDAYLGYQQYMKDITKIGVPTIDWMQPTPDQLQDLLREASRGRIDEYEYATFTAYKAGMVENSIYPTAEMRSMYPHLMGYETAASEVANQTMMNNEYLELVKRYQQWYDLLSPETISSIESNYNMLMANKELAAQIFANKQASYGGIWDYHTPLPTDPANPKNVADNVTRLLSKAASEVDPRSGKPVTTSAPNDALAAYVRAYNLLANEPQNKGLPPEYWVYRSTDDPVLWQIKSAIIGLPDEYQAILKVGSVSGLRTYEQMLYPSRPAWAVEGYQDVSPWNEFAVNALSDPRSSQLLAVTPFIIAGGLTGSFAGPIGTVIGAVGGGFAGAWMLGTGQLIYDNMAMQAKSDSESLSIAQKTFMGGWEVVMAWINKPAEYVEQALGTGAIIGNIGTSLISAELDVLNALRQGNMELARELSERPIFDTAKLAMDDPDKFVKAAWDVSSMFYESLATLHPKAQFANIFPLAEKALDAVGLIAPSKRPVVFPELGQVLAINQRLPYDVAPNLMQLQSVTEAMANGTEVTIHGGLYYLTLELAKGYKTLDQIKAVAHDMYGFTGDISDLMFQEILDPWNSLLPGVQRLLYTKLPFHGDTTKIFGINIPNKNHLVLYSGQWVDPKKMAQDLTNPSEGYITQREMEKTVLRWSDWNTLNDSQLKFLNVFKDEVTGDWKLRRYTPGQRFIKAAERFSPWNPISWVSAWNELTPVAQVHEWMNMAVDNINEQWTRAEMNTDSRNLYWKYIKTLKDSTFAANPGEVAHMAQLIARPEWMTVKQGMVESYGSVERYWNYYQRHFGYVTLLHDWAVASDMAVEDIVSGLKTRANKPTKMYNWLKKKVGADNIVMGEVQLVEAQKWFTKNPYTPMRFKAKLTEIIIDASADWAIRAFGIKERGTYLRIADSIKAAQTIMQLGHSWTYLRRNLYDNIMKRTLHGSMGLVLPGARKRYFSDGEWGWNPSRMGEGVGQADDRSRQGLLESKISKAEGIVMADSLRKIKGLGVDWIYKPAVKISGKLEQWSSDDAIYVALRKAWPYIRNRKMVKKLPRELTDWYKANGVNVEKVYRGVEGSKNTGQIRKSLTGLSKEFQMKVNSHIKDSAKAFHMDEAELREMLAYMDIDDFIDFTVATTSTKGIAEDRILEKIDDVLQRMHDAELSQFAADAAAQSAGEGLARAGELINKFIFDDIIQALRSQREWQQVIMEANAIADPYARAVYYVEQDARINRLWNNHWDRKMANLAGILQVIGFGDGQGPNGLSQRGIDVKAIYKNVTENWRPFFGERNVLRENTDWQDAESVKAFYATMKPKYIERSGLEVQHLQEMKTMMVQMLTEQFSGVDVSTLESIFDSWIGNTEYRRDLVLDFYEFLAGEQVNYRTQDVAELVQSFQSDDSMYMWGEFWKVYNASALDDFWTRTNLWGDLVADIHQNGGAPAPPTAPGQPTPPPMDPNAPVTDTDGPPPTRGPGMPVDPVGPPPPRDDIGVAENHLREYENGRAIIDAHNANVQSRPQGQYPPEIQKPPRKKPRMKVTEHRARIVKEMESVGVNPQLAEDLMALTFMHIDAMGFDRGSYLDAMSVKKATEGDIIEWANVVMKYRKDLSFEEALLFARDHVNGSFVTVRGQRIINAFKSFSEKSVTEEFMHMFVEDLILFGDQSPDLKRHLETLERLVGVTDHLWTRRQLEAAAHLGLEYLYTGKHPDPIVESALARFTDWLEKFVESIRRRLSAWSAEFNGDAIRVFDSMFRQARVARSIRFDLGEAQRPYSVENYLFSLADEARVSMESNYYMARNDDGTVVPESVRSVNFKNWFKQSEVVDADGNPLNLYHGTGADFQVFDASFTEDGAGRGTSKLGFFFSSDPWTAELFAPHMMDWGESGIYRRFTRGANVITVNLSAQKLYDLPARDFVGRFIRGREDVRTFRLGLQEFGYDGVRIVADLDLADSLGGEEYGANTYVVFEPEQIKSIFNRGTYQGPNILFSLNLDGTIQGMSEAERRALPRGASVTRFAKPGKQPSISPMTYIGMAFFDGKLVGLVPARNPDDIDWSFLREIDTDNGQIHLLADDMMGSWVYVDANGQLGTLRKDVLQTAGDPVVMGPYYMGQMAGNGATILPNSQVHSDVYQNQIKPVVRDLLNRIYNPEHTPIPVEWQDSMPDEIRTLMDNYIAEEADNLSAQKMTAMGIAMKRRDMALLNYNQRLKPETYLYSLFPYGFWTAHSLSNWVLSTVNQPAITAFYFRLLQYMEEVSDDEEQQLPNIPSRVKGKLKIPARFLPKEFGDSIFYDWMMDWLPMHQFVKPFERALYANDETEEEAGKIIYGWIQDGTITAEEGIAAFGAKTGALWQQAMDAAQELSEDTPLDYAMMFQSPNIVISGVLRAMQDKPWLATLPTLRALQGIGSLFDMDPTDLLGETGKAMLDRLVSAFGEAGQYLVDRALSNIAADMPWASEKILRQMIDGKGNFVDEARKMVQYEMGIKDGFGFAQGIKKIFENNETGPAALRDFIGATFAGLFPGSLVPTGEMKQRGAYDEFLRAYNDYNNGDTEALNVFFDKNPYVKARIALFAEPEERMRSFMIDMIKEVWYGGRLSGPEKDNFRKAFGDLFRYGFEEKDTNNYDDIPLDVLAGWANALGLGKRLPGSADTSRTPEVEPTDPALIEQYWNYEWTKNSLDPEYDNHIQEMSRYPTGDREKMLNENPAFARAMDYYRDTVIGQYVLAEVENYWDLVQQRSEIDNGMRNYLYEKYPWFEDAKAVEREMYDQLTKDFPGWEQLMDDYDALPYGTGERTRAWTAWGLDDINERIKEIYATIEEQFKESGSFKEVDNLYKQIPGGFEEWDKEHPEWQKVREIINAHHQEVIDIDPEWDENIDKYYNYPESMRSLYIQQTEPLLDVFEMKREMTQDNPELSDWFSRKEGELRWDKAREFIYDQPQEVIYELGIAVYSGLPLEAAVRAYLVDKWNDYGQPYDDFDVWIKSMGYVFYL